MKLSIPKKLLLLFTFAALFIVQAEAAGLNVEKLKTNNLTAPLGIDVIPFYSWQMNSDVRGESQSAYQILVSSTSDLLDAGNGDVWDSGKILSSASNNVAYNGIALKSKSDYYWKVRIWNQDGVQSDWSPSAYFGTAMLQASDWKTKWISAKIADNKYSKVKLTFEEPILARYIRLNVTKIGLPVDEGNMWRLQLAEMQVYGPLDTLNNIALNHSVTLSNEFIYTSWKASNLTDGIITSTSTSSGATTNTFTSGVLTTPVYIQIDLGSEMMVNSVVLYPRTDVSSKANSTLVGSFPQDYTIQTKITDGTDYTIRKTIVNQSTPPLVQQDKSLPMFGKSFEIKKAIQSAKIYVSGLGLFDLKVNGKAATNNVLEPGETNYAATVLYVTYDIKSLLSQGTNTIISTLGNGMYNNPGNTGRYQKLNHVYGSLRFLAQLEIVYTDGTRETIITDENWKGSNSAVTFSSWYGGEDYDARQEKVNIDQPGYSLTDWAPVGICSEPIGKLKAHFYERTTVMESWKAVKVSTPATGIYLVDFGRNFAGQYEFSMKAKAGTSMQIWPSELLNGSGRADQSSTGKPIYDTYTFKGSANVETWSPKFVYHGFRYLEIRGLTSAPTPDMFTAKLIRSAVEKVGTFKTSNALLNQIDVILTRSMEANLYNTLTDCPAREKLGWLEVPNILYNSVTPSYDMSAWMTKVTMDTKDAQQSNGMVPTTAPEHTVFGGSFRDDPTWGGAAIMVPWQTYTTYGNLAFLQNAYPTMSKLMDYYISRSSNNLLNYGLGEWGAIDQTTTVGFTVSCIYLQYANVMSQAAQILGKTADVTKYSTLASKIRTALNTTYYKSAKGSYDSGSQAANAMALYYGVVPAEKKDTVLQNLVLLVQNKGYHLTTGEIALKPLFMSLAQNGQNDVVYTMATQTTQPSYGYFVVKGCTTTPEYWDLSSSQNHCMMAHIESWFYEQLAGIRNNGIAFHKIIIEPYFPKGLDSINIETHSIYGKIRSCYKQNSDSTVNTTIEIPANTTGTIRLQTVDINGISENGLPLAIGNGITSFVLNNGKIEIEVGSGIYNFKFHLN